MTTHRDHDISVGDLAFALIVVCTVTGIFVVLGVL